jgi:hypothetical protein
VNRRHVAWAVAGISAALVLACDLMVLVHHQHGWPHGFAYWFEGTIGLPVWVVVGLLIVYRVPGNRLGWIALVFAFADAGQLFPGSLATLLAADGPTTPLVNWLAAVSAFGQVAVVGLIVVFAQLVPNGRVVGPRWRLPLWLTVGGLFVAGVANSFGDAGETNLVPVARAPIGDRPAVYHAMLAVANVPIFVGVAVAVLSLFVRMRRGDSTERQQIKWVLYAGVFAAGLGAIASPLASAYAAHTTWIGTLIWTTIPAALPVGTTIAVLRYRLYDIDRVVSRTVTYAVVTGAVVGGYVGLVALIVSVLGFSSSVAVAASTLAAAAAFQPVRRMVQRAIDQRFDRAAYDARRTIERFSASLRDQVDVDAVRDDLLATVTFAVAPASVSVWVAP